ncbi:MAG: IS66 family insertion sequence element accessory protein TnpB [Ferrovum myxofaciens]
MPANPMTDLYALARNEMKQDPLSGHLFCFINRRANQIKVLYWDRSGFCLWSKRLEQGRFFSDWSQIRSCRNRLDPLSNSCWRAWNRNPFSKRYSRLPTT